MQGENGLEKTRLQARAGCDTIIPCGLMGAVRVERSYDGDGVVEILSWLPVDSPFHIWSGGDKLQPREDQIEYKC